MQRDKFTRKAKYEGYFARSVYKLKDIQTKFKVIRAGDKVLDLGAAPGSWTQYVDELGAKVDAVDVTEVKFGNCIKVDIYSDSLFEKISKEYDIVLSDLAPKTVGIRTLDNEDSYDLSMKALEIAKKVLKKNGKFVCKIFQSEFSPKFVKEVKKTFFTTKIVKPVGSRKRSKEFYIVGLRKK